MKVYDNHTPFRGSNVEAWLKRHRDAREGPRSPAGDAAWNALDDLLDDYRLCADTGADLDGDR